VPLSHREVGNRSMPTSQRAAKYCITAHVFALAGTGSRADVTPQCTFVSSAAWFETVPLPPIASFGFWRHQPFSGLIAHFAQQAAIPLRTRITANKSDYRLGTWAEEWGRHECSLLSQQSRAEARLRVGKFDTESRCRG
jgi:hypothetical protein